MQAYESETYEAVICPGGRRGYDGPVFHEDDLVHAIQDLADPKLTVRIVRVRYVRKGLDETGFEIRASNYPPNNTDRYHLAGAVFTLADRLAQAFGQKRVTVIVPEKTVTLEFD